MLKESYLLEILMEIVIVTGQEPAWNTEVGYRWNKVGQMLIVVEADYMEVLHTIRLLYMFDIFP